MAYTNFANPSIDMLVPAIRLHDNVDESTVQVYIRVLEEHLSSSPVSEDDINEHRVKCLIEAVDEIVCLTLQGERSNIDSLIISLRNRRANILKITEV